MEPTPQNNSHSKTSAALVIAALGVVFGDIGTSPLYALREAFHGPHAVAISTANVMGVLSLVFWTLMLIVTVKYGFFIMRADNDGEGGVLALTSLFARLKGKTLRNRSPLLILGLFGSALLFGDGILTPAISVLGAVEGLKIATPVFSGFVVPLTILILLGLFLSQHYGSQRIGTVFGPIMVLWFIALAALGIGGIWQNPSVLQSINPIHGIHFLIEQRALSLSVLGAVFLTVTGTEALYADMGHFGRAPIMKAWFWLVFPSLLLNYMGQGAILLLDSANAENPFYYLAPKSILYPLIALSTAAAIIASQALISGVFSLTKQAIQLGYMPRVRIVHTSGERMGQIYIPFINKSLLVLTVWLVLEFGSSSALASAYGIAVSLTMAITTAIAYFVTRKLWNWNLVQAGLFLFVFLAIDLMFFGANATKMADGGWFPLLMGAAIFTLMTTWHTGRKILYERLREQSVPVKDFVLRIQREKPVRVHGTAFFMSGDPEGTPLALIHNMRHNHVLHENVALLTISTKDVPFVEKGRRMTIDKIDTGVHRLVAQYGFMEQPDIKDVIESCNLQGLKYNLPDITFFLGRETIIPTDQPGMAIWREKLFSFMSRNAERATLFYNIPVDQVVEVGLQVEM